MHDNQKQTFTYQELHLANSLLTAVMQNTDDLIAALDTHYRFIGFNTAYQQGFKTLFGKEIALGDNLMEALANAPWDKSKVVEGWKRALAGEAYHITQVFGEAEADQKFYELNFSSIRDEQGRLIGASHIARDVTANKKTEQTMHLYAEKLKLSNRDLEQFAYVASHDLQEPLRMVSNYCQLLKRRYAGKLDQDADEFIEYAVDGAKRMQRLIDDLLAYSRVGSRSNALVPVDLESVLKNALKNVQEAISESKAVVTNGPLPKVVGDADQLIQLFQNLIANALKFNQGVPQVHISAIKNEGEWVFSVQDNGIGIAPEFFERIFILFQRLHNKVEYSGTGIGLAICKKIVDRHGGRIWIESQPGQGSKFLFTLPEKPLA